MLYVSYSAGLHVLDSGNPGNEALQANKAFTIECKFNRSKEILYILQEKISYLITKQKYPGEKFSDLNIKSTTNPKNLQQFRLSLFRNLVEINDAKMVLTETNEFISLRFKFFSNIRPDRFGISQEVYRCSVHHLIFGIINKALNLQYGCMSRNLENKKI